MARIKLEPPPELFSRMMEASKELGDKNDCAVKAVALVTDTPYEKAQELLFALGRKRHDGTPQIITDAAIGKLGWNIKTWTAYDRREVIAHYPGVHANLLSITTHHPRRFPDVWEKFAKRRLLLFSAHHVAAYVNGKVNDWSINKALRVKRVVEVLSDDDLYVPPIEAWKVRF